MMDLDPEARRILELARAARTPSEKDKARFERRLATGLGLSMAAGSSVAAAEAAKGLSVSKAAGSLLALKWWIGGGVLVTLAVVGYANLSASGPRQPAPMSAPRALTAPNASAVQAEPATTLQVAQPLPASSEPQHVARRVEHRRRAAGEDSLASELELLHRAQAAWRNGDGRLALALLDQHRASYPRSALGLERDALQVLTLCDLGRQADAARSARSFLARAPHSPLRASIEQSCAGK